VKARTDERVEHLIMQGGVKRDECDDGSLLTHARKRRLGRADEARDADARALKLAHNEPERRLLQRRLAEVGA